VDFTAEVEAEGSVDPAEDLAELDSVVPAAGLEVVTSAVPVWVAADWADLDLVVPA